MKIISFIEDEEIISKILKHLGLWDVKHKPPPRANSPPPEAFIIYDQSSAPNADDYLIDADRTTLRLSTGYPIETYLMQYHCFEFYWGFVFYWAFMKTRSRKKYYGIIIIISMNIITMKHILTDLYWA